MDVNAIKNNLAGMAGSSAPEYAPREVEEEKGILDSMTDYVKGAAEWVADSAVGQAVGGVVNAAWEDTRDALAATSWNDMQEAANRHNISNTVNSIANDNSSMLQPLAQAVQQSPVVYNYLMDNSGKLVQARTIQREIGIPADVTMADSASWKRANELYQENLEYKKLAEDNGTQWTLDNLYAKHPEIKNIADKDPAAGALVLKDMPSVRKEMDIIDGFTQFLSMGNKELELNNLRFKSYGNVLDDNDRQRMQDLEKQLDIEKQLYDVKFRNDPLMFALSGVGQSLPEMWQSIRTGAEDAAAWSAAATWAGAGTGAAVGAVAGPAGAAAGATAGGIIGAAAAAVKGTIKAVTAHETRKAILSQVATRAAAKATAPQLMKNGMTFGALRGMAAPETGSRYDEYRNLRDAQGNRLLSDEEAWRDALLGGTVNAALETVPTFGVLGKIAKPGTQGARIIEDIVTRNTAKTQLGADIQKGARKLFSNTLKVAGTESFEEGTQQAADDIIMNSIKASHGGRAYTEKYGVLYDQGKAMTAGEILADSATAAIEAIPSSMAFGLAGAVGGGAASGGRYAIRQRHLLKNETDAERMARHTYTGAVMAEQLQEAVHSSELQKTAPDVQAQLIKEKAAGTGFEIMYIDTEMALQKENGQQDLEALAKAAGINEEALQTAVDTKGTIAVPLESFAQSEASSELLDSASFDTETDSMARMRENAKYTMEKMRENAEKLVEHQINLVQTIPKELYPEDTPEAELNRQLVEAAIITDINNPIRGLNQLIQEAEADKLAILQPALDFLADTSGKGVSIVDTGDGRTIRVSENAQWYQEFYKEHKRKPTKQELMDIASDMVSGKSNIEFWAVTDAEGEAAANEIASELEKANRKLEVLNGVKEKMKGINGTEMKIAESMTADVYKVYRKYMDLLKNAPGLASRAARVNAVMFAHMMERLAENTRRATGNREYTAMDAANRIMLNLDGKMQDEQNAMSQVEKSSSYEAWAGFIKNIQTGEYLPDVMNVMQTPAVFTLIELPSGKHADINTPIQITKKVLHKILSTNKTRTSRGHGNEIDGDILLKIPEKIADPVMILKNRNGDGEIIPNDVIVVIDLKDKNGNTIIVSISLKRTNGTYKIKSVFAKNSTQWFEKRVQQGDLLYANKNKIVSEMKHTGHQSPPGSFANNLVSYNIPNESDLVNLVNENIKKNSDNYTDNYTQEKKESSQPGWPDYKSGAVMKNPSKSASVISDWLEKVNTMEADNKKENADITVLNQAMVSGVDVDQFVEVADITDSLPEGKVTSQSVLAYIRKLIAEETKIKTADNEAIMSILPKDARHITYSSRKGLRKKDESNRKKILLSIKDLIAMSTLIERIPNTKKDQKPHVKAYYRFYVPVRISNRIKTIRIVAEEQEGGIETSPKLVNLYDVIEEKKRRTFPPTGISPVAEPESPSSKISIREMLKGVKDYNGNLYVLEGEKLNQDIKGQTAAAANGQYIVSLFEKADESTFMHEMAHVYLLELEKLAVLDERCRADFDAVMEWATYKNGDEKYYKGSPFAKEFKTLAGNIRAAEDAGDVDTADRLKRQWAHERFARGFEMYLEHGTAPSKALQGAFRKFKQFLKTLYIAFTGEGVRANAKVEKVMARMLASDEEIEAMALDDRYKDISKAGGEKLLQETQKETYQRWYSEAQEEAKERLMKIMMADLEEENQRKYDAAMAAERAKKEAELEDLPLYIAQKIIQESGDENAIVELGIYPTVEQYKTDLAECGSMETVLGDYMAWYAESLDRQKIQTHTTEEQLAKMMEQTVYHKKLMAFEAEAMREKEKMVNKINSKAKNAIDELSTTIDNLPEGVDIQADFKSEAVKKLVSAVNKLRFSTRWTAQEIAEIDNILKQATPEDMKKALDNFSKEATSWKKNLKTIEEAFKGRMNIIRDMARKDLAKRSIAEACDQGKYQAAEKRAAELMHRMIRASKWDVAMVQQEARFTSAAMAEAAEKNRDKVNKVLERVKKQLTAKTVKLPAEERYWIRKLAHDLKLDKNWQKDMGRPTSEGVRLVPEEPTRPEECRELSQIFDELKNSLEIQGDMLEALSAVYQPGFTDYRALTISQLEACANIITVLYKTGKDKFQLKSFDGKLLSDVVDEIVLDVDAAGNVLNMPQVNQKKVNDDAGGIGYNDFLAKIPGLGPTLSGYGAKYLTAHMKPEELIRLLGNAAHRYLYNLYDRAAGENGKRTAEAVRKLQEIMSVYSRKEKQDFGKQRYELRTGAGVERLSKENVICMALNMGTDINFVRLYKGLGITWEAAQAFIEENMTKRDWETVQAIWDYIGSFWPETVKVEEELNGVTLEGVEAKEFTVMCEGEPLRMKGGYYPIAYNPVKSTKAETQTMDAVTQRNMSGAQVLGTGRGFTKARSETENIERPLLLQFNVIPNHLQEVIQNITFRIAARDAYRLTHSLNFEEHVRSTLGNEALKSINQWVVDCWRIMPTDIDQGTSLFSRSLGFLRRNAAINIMGYRLWPAVENVTNLFPMMDRIGAVNTISALGDYMAHRQENDKLLLKSIFMTNRINSMDRDIGMTPGIFEAGYKATDWLKEHAYSALTFTDLMFSKPLWCRSYKDAFAKNFQKVMEEEQLKKLQLEEAQETVEALKADIAPYSRELYMLKNSLQEGGEYELEAGPGDYESISGKHERIAYLENYLKPLRKELWKAEVELDRLSNLPVKSQADIVAEAEKRSAQAADEAVRSVFGSGQTKDLAAVQKGGEFLKLFTAFYSFFNTQANAILAAYYKGKFQRDELAGATGLRRWMPFAKAVFYRIILTSAMSTVMKMVLLGDGDDDKHKYRKVKNADGTEIDEEVPVLERFMVQFAKNTVSTASGTAVGLRDIVGLYTNLIFEGTDYGRGASIGSVGMGVIDKLTQTFKLASQQEEKNTKIEEQELRRQARYDKMTPAAKKKFDEDLKYRKPVHRTTYVDIGKSLTQAATSVTAGRTGITDSIANTVMTTLQYMADGDGCYDKSLSNMAWSAIWNKKPVAREIPKKPSEEKKKKKTKGAR
jgi:hypothetical protein